MTTIFEKDWFEKSTQIFTNENGDVNLNNIGSLRKMDGYGFIVYAPSAILNIDCNNINFPDKSFNDKEVNPMDLSILDGGFVLKSSKSSGVCLIGMYEGCVLTMQNNSVFKIYNHIVNIADNDISYFTANLYDESRFVIGEASSENNSSLIIGGIYSIYNSSSIVINGSLNATPVSFHSADFYIYDNCYLEVNTVEVLTINDSQFIVNLDEGNPSASFQSTDGRLIFKFYSDDVKYEGIFNFSSKSKGCVNMDVLTTIAKPTIVNLINIKKMFSIDGDVVDDIEEYFYIDNKKTAIRNGVKVSIVTIIKK